MAETADAGGPEIFDPVEVQAAHRRIVDAKDRGEEPNTEDSALAERVMASPFWMFDRPWARDEW